MPRFALFLLAVATSLSAQCSFAAERSLTVFAATSLMDVLQQLSEEFTRGGGGPVRLSFAASSALARQIESGARADVFFSADREWMDYLQARNLIRRASRRDLLGNRLALIVPRASRASFALGRCEPLLGALGDRGRLAIADPDFAPAGKYAKAALSTLGCWDALEPRAARADNVRIALLYVARGEAPLGVVYATDAASEPRVRILGVFAESTHPPIVYPLAATVGAAPAADAYLDFLSSEAARATFERAGFRVMQQRQATR